MSEKSSQEAGGGSSSRGAAARRVSRGAGKAAGRPTLERETALGWPRLLIAGVDEVGRGCLAGPVVAGAVILPGGIGDAVPWIAQVKDSKLLSPEDRAELAPRIRAWARAWAIGEATPEEIDLHNIHRASHLAMARAIAGLGVRADRALVDGKFLPQAGKGGIPADFALPPMTAVIKGDLTCLSVACASVLAKVHRDAEMERLDAVYPHWGFAVHKGYPTPAHGRALDEHGVCPIHRRSFGPVATRAARV